MTAPRGGPARSPRPSGGAKGAIVVGIAVILGIVLLQILDDSGDGSSSSATGTTVAGVTTTTPAASTVPLKPNSAVRVKVYNASSVQGVAQTLTDQLHGAGYDTQAPQTLDKKTQGTIVECVSGFEREGVTLALYAIGNGAQPAAYPSDPPEGASDADCIVIIGSA